MDACKNCFYYREGRCHRDPPQQVIKGYLYDPSVMDNDALRAIVQTQETSLVANRNWNHTEGLQPFYYSGWPLVKETDYCGEFKLKTNPKEPDGEL